MLKNQAGDQMRPLLSGTPPILLKGILHEEDARHAMELGISGLIVSNHGGRTLDTLPPTSAVLARIRAAVGTDYPLLVDGGIRRGTDVLKAIALAANAVLIGRPYVYGRANTGAMGVSHVIRLLRDDWESRWRCADARRWRRLALPFCLTNPATVD
jgi:4-hydroxymandelate oxidase